MSEATARPNPFVGAKPLQIGRKLYGRDWETRMLHGMVLSKRFVLLHAPSGAGKTSLIQAGLWPLLSARFRVSPPIRVNGLPDPGSAARNRYVYSTLQALDPASGLKDPGEQRLRDCRLEGDTSKPELWIFDQFEEAVSLDPVDEATKREFFEELADALADQDCPRWALFSMREDYLGAIQPFLKLLPTGLSARFRLELLDIDAAKQSIAGIAAEGAGSFASGAADLLVADLRRIQFQHPNGAIEARDGPVVEPVQLQVVCRWLWDCAARRGTPVTVTPEDVTAPTQGNSGGGLSSGIIDVALAAYYAQQLKTLAAGDLGLERRMRDWFERQLIINRKLRSQVMRGQECKYVDEKTVRQLVESWLVREEPRGGRNWFELSHDRLIQPILSDNAAWREKNLTPFQKAFEAWRSQGRAPALLLRGAALLEAVTWVKQHNDEVLKDEHDYLDKCQEAAGRAHREQGTNFAETGWGVVWAPGTSGEVRSALRELLNHRRDLAGKLFAEFEYRPGENATQFLARYGAPSGQPDPEKVPYYLLLIGGPEVIPFEFQYGLDMNHAVGRLAFEHPVEYARYARSLVAAETGKVALLRDIGIFSPLPANDTASKVLHDSVIEPMLARLGRACPEWTPKLVLRDAATKQRLSDLLGGPDTPSLLYAAAHGISFKEDDPLQRDYQGALLCQDWPGVGTPVTSAHYFRPEDLPADPRLLGLIVFLFGEFTAGTPELDDFCFQLGRKQNERRRLARQPFVARLPQRLLSHSAGGALAVIAHVDRGWLVPTLNPAGDGDMLWVLRRLMRGATVGSAMDAMNQRYSRLSVWLADTLRPLVFGEATRTREVETQLVHLQTAAIDARNYVILGDPAARLPVDPDAKQVVRPAIEPVELTAEVFEERRAEAPVTKEARIRLDIQLRRTAAQPEATAQPYSARLRWEYPGKVSTVELMAGPFDFAALEAALDDPRSYGKILGEGLLGRADSQAREIPELAQPESAREACGARALYAALMQARSAALTFKLDFELQLDLDPAAPELHTIHWELLRDPAEGALLFGSPTIFARRTQSIATPRLASFPKQPAALVAGASGLARRSLAGMTISELAAANLAAVSEGLAKRQHILWLAPHSISGTAPEPAIEFDGAEGKPTQRVTAAAVAQGITGAYAPQLVILESRGKPGQDSAAALVAAQFTSAGIPAVVVLRVGKEADALRVFLESLFRELLKTGQIDVAMRNAREAAPLQGFSAPVLYLGSRSGRLFCSAGPPTAVIPVAVSNEYIPRRELQDQVVNALLKPGSRWVALTGMAGAGKSAVARAVYNDPRIVSQFPGIRLWATVKGLQQRGELLRSWTSALGGEPDSANRDPRGVLSDLIGERRALLVLDEVSTLEDAKAFELDNPGCTYLITTRDQQALPEHCPVIPVGVPETETALQILSAGLDPSLPGFQENLLNVASRLGDLPLALKLANGVLRERVIGRGQRLNETVDYLLTAIEPQRGTGFQASEFAASIGRAIEASFETLSPEQRERLSELVVFVEEAAVPIRLVSILWQSTAGLEPGATMDLLRLLSERSLLRLDPKPPEPPATVRMHPVIRAYLAAGMEQDLGGLHRKLLDAAVPELRQNALIDPTTITTGLDPYLREHLTEHVVAAGRGAMLGSAISANGVDALSGCLLSPALPQEPVAREVAGLIAESLRDELEAQRRRGDTTFTFGVPPDLADFRRVGWGVIAGARTEPAMRECLRALIEHRSRSMGRPAPVFTVFPGESKTEFLARNGVVMGQPSFQKVPYYLLIVGSPNEVPFEFQASLNSEFATGRLHFDTPNEYAAYIQLLIEYETRPPIPGRDLLIWAPQATFDRETSISASYLVPAVAEQFRAPGLRNRILRGTEATKGNLWRALTAPAPPAVLFTTGHGLAFQGPHEQLLTRQGALLGQEWELDTPITSAAMLSADDMGPQTKLNGLIHFAFSSYSAGTSLAWPGDAREPYARMRRGDQAFVAALPRRLLTSGALAFIGYLGRTWSFPYAQTSQNSVHAMLIEPYASVLRQLAQGTPAGHALRQLHQHTSLLASSLTQDSRQISCGRTPKLDNLLQRWTAWRNGCSLLLVGDPAAQIHSQS